MADDIQYAPGWPGIPPRWTSSAKSAVATALSPMSRVWFTLSHGIFNEIYFPRVDQACTRDLGLVVTDGREFFAEEKRHARSEIVPLAEGVPAYRVTNTCLQGRFRVEKEILADPRGDAVLQRTWFVPLAGGLDEYHVYVLLAPHLGNRGNGNTAWVGSYKGVPMLFAERGSRALAVACSVPWAKRSAGFVGVSDGWQDLAAHRRMTWEYSRAENGNTALTAEVDLKVARGTFLLTLGFGATAFEAGYQALASLRGDFESTRDEYLDGWRRWQESLLPLDTGTKRPRDLYRVSTAALRTHEAKQFGGGIIASLSVPWGFAKSDDDIGGYHLVWPRDLVETAGALLAAGAHADARRVLYYLQVTQEADGHWPQNMWLDGESFWGGVQLDETAFPILLVDLARRSEALGADEVARLWPMVRRAAGFIVRNGPVTQQDRWEEDPGYSPFTLAVVIAALLVAADLADGNGEPRVAAYLQETADIWNASVERWTYVTGTELSRRVGVEGYYVRIAPPEAAQAASALYGFVPIKNRPPEHSEEPAAQIVSPDALALVRFGLRAAEDPRVLNTVRVIDALLEVNTPGGPAWHRYNGDGYGEHEDGAPFDGTGVGRAWPLLTGERAHYELAAGRWNVAERLLGALEAFANESGLLSEQLWDAPDIPERGLFFGRPSGAAMPLAWAHAEYVKLRRSLHDRRIFDMPPQTHRRYTGEWTAPRYAVWRFNHKCRGMHADETLRIEVLAPSAVHWSTDGWATVHDSATRDSGLGVHLVDLPTARLRAGGRIDFTFYWPEAHRWEGIDYAVVTT